MILVWGPPTDPPIVSVIDALELRGAEVYYLPESALANLRYDVVFSSSSPSGWIESSGRRVAVENFRGIYLRPTEPAAGQARTAAMVLLAIAAGLSSVVVNRPAAGRANASKPYQIELIKQSGFLVPETLVTSDPTAARAFLHRHKRLVYKSLSGIRSIVATLDASEEARLDNVGTGPVQLQTYVPGLDVRVHVVGEQWFACAIESSASDYRYAGADGTGAKLSAFKLPKQIGRQLVTLVRRMNLLVAGVDLRQAPDGSWVCFEVNPSPGFPWYEEATGHQIGDAIANLLTS
jgi:glutathione synthase/RimK-type ligase-like ATP-grasp enzyme